MFEMRCESLHEYEVCLARGVFDSRNRALATALAARPALFVVDAVIDRLYGEALRSYLDTLPVPAFVHVRTFREAEKSLDAVLDICSVAQRLELGRRDPLVAVGGGICKDVVAVSASLIRRGVPYVCVPTTLLGQVDAGIGIKGGVNFGGAKNYLGCFTPPETVLLDPLLLRSLPQTELRAGLAEVLKMALVRDERLFDVVALCGRELIDSSFSSPEGVGEAIVARAAMLMLEELTRNPYEQGSLERLADAGHSFSGRLEEESNFRLSHGEAVAIDLALSSAVAAELGLFAEQQFETVIETLSTLGLPVLSPHCNVETLASALDGTTRHRNGMLHLVLPTAIGRATFVRNREDVPTTVLSAALTRLQAAAVRTERHRVGRV